LKPGLAILREVSSPQLRREPHLSPLCQRAAQQSGPAYFESPASRTRAHHWRSWPGSWRWLRGADQSRRDDRWQILATLRDEGLADRRATRPGRYYNDK